MEAITHHNNHQMAVAPNIAAAAPGHIPQSIPCVSQLSLKMQFQSESADRKAARISTD